MTIVVVTASARADTPAPGRVDIARTYKAAAEAFKQERYEQALEGFASLVAVAPDQPFFQWNYARCLEETGRLAEAHDAFLAASRHEHLPAENQRAAMEWAHKLHAVRERSVLVVHLADDERAYLDGVHATGRVVTTPGEHMLCILRDAGTTLACWVQVLQRGRRIAWPSWQDAGVPAVVRWGPPDSVMTATLNGMPFAGDPRLVERLELDAGGWEVELTYSDREPETLAWALSPGDELSSHPGPPRVDSTPTVPDVDSVGLQDGVSPAPTRANASVLPWVVAGGGGLALLGGTVLLVVGQQQHEAVQDAVPGTLTMVAARERWEQGSRMSAAGLGLAVGGAALGIGGIIWGLVGAHGDDAESRVAPVAVIVAPSQGGSVRVSGTVRW